MRYNTRKDSELFVGHFCGSRLTATEEQTRVRCETVISHSFQNFRTRRPYQMSLEGERPIIVIIMGSWPQNERI